MDHIPTPEFLGCPSVGSKLIPCEAVGFTHTGDLFNPDPDGNRLP